VTQHRSGTGGEHGGHPPPLGSQQAVADRINAGVDAVEPPHRQPVLDPAPAEPGPQELPSRYDAVLPRGEGGDPGVDRVSGNGIPPSGAATGVRSNTYLVFDRARVGHRAEDGPRKRTRGAQIVTEA